MRFSKVRIREKAFSNMRAGRVSYRVTRSAAVPPPPANVPPSLPNEQKNEQLELPKGEN